MRKYIACIGLALNAALLPITPAVAADSGSDCDDVKQCVDAAVDEGERTLQLVGAIVCDINPDCHN